jgi:hypothetical protein
MGGISSSAYRAALEPTGSNLLERIKVTDKGELIRDFAQRRVQLLRQFSPIDHEFEQELIRVSYFAWTPLQGGA